MTAVVKQRSAGQRSADGLSDRADVLGVTAAGCRTTNWSLQNFEFAQVFILRNQISVEGGRCLHVWGNVSGGGGIGRLMRRLIVVSSSEGGSSGVLPITVGVWLANGVFKISQNCSGLVQQQEFFRPFS